MESITLSIWQLILLLGIPTALTAFFFRRIEKRMDEKEKAREEHEFLVVKSVSAALALGEATAEAVQRIPDTHCNGNMHAALAYARQVKHEQKDFLNRQAIKAVV